MPIVILKVLLEIVLLLILLLVVASLILTCEFFRRLLKVQIRARKVLKRPKDLILNLAILLHRGSFLTFRSHLWILLVNPCVRYILDGSRRVYS